MKKFVIIFPVNILKILKKRIEKENTRKNVAQGMGDNRIYKGVFSGNHDVTLDEFKAVVDKSVQEIGPVLSKLANE